MITSITPVKLSWNTVKASALPFAAATSATDGFVIPWNYQDEKTVVFIQNSSTDTAYAATIKKGNGLQGCADLTTGDITAGDIVAVSLESGAFKNVSGTNKDNVIIIPANVALKVAVVVLP